MGAGLVQRALFEPVDDAAKTILIAMALTALDVARTDQESAIYYGGRDYLIEVMQGTVPDAKTPEYRVAARTLARRIQKLTQAGSIQIVEHANGRRRARYRLVLPATYPVDHPLWTTAVDKPR